MIDNQAILNEFARIKGVVDEKLQIEITPKSFSLSTKNNDGTWKFGEVMISYQTKGNSKLTKLLEHEGYYCKSRKVADSKNIYGGYEMCTVATKYIELIY